MIGTISLTHDAMLAREPTDTTDRHNSLSKRALSGRSSNYTSLNGCGRGKERLTSVVAPPGKEGNVTQPTVPSPSLPSNPRMVDE